MTKEERIAWAVAHAGMRVEIIGKHNHKGQIGRVGAYDTGNGVVIVSMASQLPLGAYSGWVLLYPGAEGGYYARQEDQLKLLDNYSLNPNMRIRQGLERLIVVENEIRSRGQFE